MQFNSMKLNNYGNFKYGVCLRVPFSVFHVFSSRVCSAGTCLHFSHATSRPSKQTKSEKFTLAKSGSWIASGVTVASFDN